MKQEIPIDQLVVNPENYRFDPVDNQGEAIDLMLEEKGDEIINLAKHIYEHGLDQAKDSRVLELKKDLFLVLDGNRRATAIKCLNDPSLVKDERRRSRFLKIVKGEGRIPKVVNCFVYRSEGEAAEWIRLDHTGKNAGVGQDPWEYTSKDRFDYKFGGKLSPATQAINLLQHETKKVIDSKNLKMTTVSRILSNPDSRSYLGVDIKNGAIILIANKKDVIDRLDQLVSKIIADDVPVREVYHTKDSIAFMRGLFGERPQPAAKPTMVSPKGSIEPVGKKVLKSLPRSGGRSVLIPKSCILRIHEPKINNIYHELKTVPLDAATNAVGVLFRVFLETSLDFYANKFGLTFSSSTKLAGKITKISEHLEKKGAANSTQLKNVRSVATKGNSILSIETFHEYVHSFKTQPVPVDLIYKWDNLQEFFEILWNQTA